MIPSPRGPFFLFLLIPLILFIGGFILPILIKAAILVNILLFILGGLDVFLSSRIKIDVSAGERKLFSIGRINNIPLTLINRSKWTVPLEVKLSVPEFFEDISEKIYLKMEALSEETVTFRLRPTRRGSYQITNAYYRIRTGFGWFHLSGSKEIAMTV
ncbi:MAG TPA: hypothetical protein ENI73_06335, partial [Spirochaetes bacterium]|nr:hypothetical protein [Spirochaetota bacterium]